MPADERASLVAAAGNVKRLEELLCKEGIDVNQADEDGITPLMAAARAGKLKVVQRLLEISSPQLNAADPEGRTALDHALDAHQQDVVDFMLADTSLLPFARGLLPALARGDAAAARSLLTSSDARLRGDPNQRDPRGQPALHYVVKSGSLEILAVLLDQAGLKVNARDRYLRTALDLAREAGRDELVGLLKAKGAKAGDDIEELEDD
mmetsp:Transcript_66814/g.169432  ORF Transcript_66814/g.169432 Transcript_66814/m.169432 type:complete len:208 (+) Transcript_66814:72-695(+)